MKLIVVVPCSNNEKHLAEILARIPRKVRGFETVETLLVDDHSTDASVSLARNLRVDYVIAKRVSHGPSATYISGVKQALRAGASVVVTLNATDWHFPDNFIEKLARPIAEGKATAVVARKHTVIRRIGKAFRRSGKVIDSSPETTKIRLNPAQEVVLAASRGTLRDARKLSSTLQARYIQLVAPTAALQFYNYNKDTYSTSPFVRRLRDRLGEARVSMAVSVRRSRAALCILAFFLVFYTAVTVAGPRIYSTPEENVRAYFYSLEKQEGLYKGLSYAAGANQAYHTTLIKPRNTVINYRGKVVPSDFLGVYIYFYPFLFLGFTAATMYLMYLLLAVLTLWAVYRLAARLFTAQVAAIATVVTGFFPVFLYWEGHMMPDIPSLGLILLGCSYYLDYLQRPNKKYWHICLASALMCIGVSIRYTNLLLVGFFILFYAPYRQYRTWRTLRQHIAAFCIGALFLLPILLLNDKLYGGFTETGQQLYSGTASVLRTTSVNILQSFVKYFVDFLGVLLVLAVIGARYMVRDAGTSRRFVLFAATYGAALFYYFSRAADVYGASSDEVLLNYSEPRYYLPIFILLGIMAAYLFAKFVAHCRLYYILLAVLVVVFCASGFEYRGTGIVPSIEQADTNRTTLAELKSELPENAYVFTQLSDRFLFPRFQVVSYYNSGLDSVSGRAQKTAALASDLLKHRQPVYFLWETVSPNVSIDRNYGSLSTYQAYFRRAGINLTPQPIEGDLYQMTRTGQ